MLSKIMNKQKGIFLALLLALIVVAEFAIETPHFPTWPAMMCMVFFFCVHRDAKQAPHILVGGAFGILNVWIIKYWYNLTVPMLGGDMSKYTDPHTQEALFHSKIIYILIFVTCILMFKDVVSWVFNDFTFMFFIVAGLAGSANSTAGVIAKTIAGTAVKAAGSDPATMAAVKAATDKAVAASVPVTNVFTWIGVELIGGGIIILAIIGIGKLIGKIMGASAAPPAAHH